MYQKDKIKITEFIIFCLIGIFVVIPIFGAFRILWAAGAEWITYMYYKNGFPLINTVQMGILDKIRKKCKKNKKSS